MLKCTMPGCRSKIRAMTGLQELEKIQKHFKRVHKIELSMEAALKFRLAMEAGHPPVRFEKED
jgi:hypothetical protein